MTDLDVLAADEVVDLLIDAEAHVVPAVRAASPAIVAAAELLTGVIVGGGRIAFAGAGTSGRLAAAEAAELPGTFGIDAARCPAVIAGDGPVIDDSAEDDADAGRRGVGRLDLRHGDALVAVAASGRTPFTLAAAEAARGGGARVIAIVTAPGSPLAADADVAIEVSVGDEVLRGSTRCTAGTAQKVVLNTLTTTAMARAGRVHGDLMIDVVPANAKLRDRAAGIVAEIAGCDVGVAKAALDACDQDARAAVVQLVRGLPPTAARDAAAAHPTLRAALTAAPAR